MSSSPARATVVVGAAVIIAAEVSVPVPNSLQAELEHFRNAVNTLIQELAAEHAFRKNFGQERIAWETGGERDDVEDEPPQHQPAAPTTPVRSAQPQHFSVSPTAAGMEWGSSASLSPLRWVGAPEASPGGRPEPARTPGRAQRIHGHFGTQLETAELARVVERHCATESPTRRRDACCGV